jgi:hypothetical protein
VVGLPGPRLCSGTGTAASELGLLRLAPFLGFHLGCGDSGAGVGSGRRRGRHSAVAGGAAGEAIPCELGRAAASRRGAVGGRDVREEQQAPPWCEEEE